jgi:cell wall-associated NlpC family hydrolase
MARYRRRMSGGQQAAVAAVVGLAIAASGKHLATAAHTAGPPGHVAAVAIAYAQGQIGKPYIYGASGPSAFDCSSLTQAAYAHAGLSIPRTSEGQWAAMQHVSSPQPGDLVFFTGSPIDAPPGHVGIVVNPARHLMIDAYGSGTAVRYDTYGLPSSAPGLSDPTGFADA